MALHIGGLTRLGGDRARRSALAARVQRTVKAIIAATKRDVGAEVEVELTAPTILECVCDDPDRLDISATAPPTKLTFGGAVPRPPTNRPTELMRRCDAGWSSQSNLNDPCADCPDTQCNFGDWRIRAGRGWQRAAQDP